ncbi:phosphotransferase [Comamonas piscis]|uniref:Phosphotransferase n=1 Tax=Comamonas piscis TaxID=1562974 RepID=A0A7G5ECV4_9BURK|nr:phosphotransferase [Comamonas piscis]QMV71829.1 phosphotransferase [Comamonas piscis]WSO34558.1 phosphotransferase [Comamonas piscis]
MSDPIAASSVAPQPDSTAQSLQGVTPVVWADADRAAQFAQWLAATSASHGLLPETLRLASADASFRRYLRVDDQQGGTRIIMDAPPDKENSEPFVKVQALLAQAGLNAPEVQAWDAPHGFMLLSDLGTQTVIEKLQPPDSQAAYQWYMQAVDILVDWQKASREGVLPVYDEAILRRELQLFPDWYIAQHRQVVLNDKQQAVLKNAFDAIVAQNLSVPRVFVHRDFMMRNLMVPAREGAPLGVLDFQDALYGPITYDIASLMRDAFITWEEDFVVDITIRYWDKARKAGLLGADSPSGFGADFGDFYRAVEWMGIQRHLKVAGIFARLTLRDGKPRYLADAPRFLHYIRSTASRYRELVPLMRLIHEVEGIEEQGGWMVGRG